MGKTSVASRLNLPGRVAWMTMEAPGFLTLLYLMSTMPERHGIDDLPWQNRVLGGLFVSLFPPLSHPHTFLFSPPSCQPLSHSLHNASPRPASACASRDAM